MPDSPLMADDTLMGQKKTYTGNQNLFNRAKTCRINLKLQDGYAPRKAGTKYHVDLHAIVDGDISVKAGHNISHQLKDHLRTAIPNLGHILIHIEPNR